jgi:Tol biopolymer transport system component
MTDTGHAREARAPGRDCCASWRGVSGGSSRTSALPTTRCHLAAAIVLALVAGLFVPPGFASGAPGAESGSIGRVEQVSVAPDGSQSDDSSWDVSLSADGRLVAFSSAASNLVPGDTNGATDVFVHDRQAGVTERVSVASDGTEANESSSGVSISPDGRYVAFLSTADNLVPDKTTWWHDVFVHDRQAGVTERVSVASDGREANWGSEGPVSVSISGHVAFTSQATNLVPGVTGSWLKVYVRDLEAGTTEVISVSSSGTVNNQNAFGPSISADGRHVAFTSRAGNLVPGKSTINNDVFVRDRQAGITERVSVASDGSEVDGHSGQASISADGGYVAFTSEAIDLVPDKTTSLDDVFVHDRQAGTTERVSAAADGTESDDDSGRPSISAEGRYVAFESSATNLVAGGTTGELQIFVHDLQSGASELMSVAPDGSEGDEWSGSSSISADGRFVAFTSLAGNLVAGGTRNRGDVYVARTVAPGITRALEDMLGILRNMTYVADP